MAHNTNLPISVAEALGENGTSSGKKRFKWLVVLILLLAAGVTSALAIQGMDRPDSVRYKTQKVERGKLTVTVAATGNLEPTNQVDVGSELSGTVLDVAVEENSRVKVGQILVGLDTTRLEAQYLEAKAELASAGARVLQTRATTREAENNMARLKHVRQLSNNKVPSQYELDAAEATLARARADAASAKAAVSQTRATLKVTEIDLKKAVIRSPMNGVVLDRDVEPGQTVAASLQAPVLFTLAEDLAQMELKVDVDEADVGLVQEGQEATFVVDAYSDRKFKAQITRVCYGSDTTDGVVTYETVLKLDNKDLSLRPGMTATAEIIVKNLENILLIPNAALRFSPPVENKNEPDRSLMDSLLPGPPKRNRDAHEPTPIPGHGRKIWILQNGQPHPVSVEIGASDGVRTRVMGESLAPGMQVILERQTDGKG